MLAKRSSLVALCLGLALLHGCRRQNDYLTITHEVSPQPPRVGQSAITLSLTDANGKPITGAEVILEGNMSHAGMVPVYAETTEVTPGRYGATIELTMAGDWNITVHISLEDGRSVKRQFEIKGVANR